MIVSFRCGEVPLVVHAARAVLAAGLSGTGHVPARVDPADSVSVGGHCRRERARTVARHPHASRKTRAWTARPVTREWAAVDPKTGLSTPHPQLPAASPGTPCARAATTMRLAISRP